MYPVVHCIERTAASNHTLKRRFGHDLKNELLLKPFQGIRPFFDSMRTHFYFEPCPLCPKFNDRVNFKIVCIVIMAQFRADRIGINQQIPDTKVFKYASKRTGIPCNGDGSQCLSEIESLIDIGHLISPFGSILTYCLLCPITRI